MTDSKIQVGETGEYLNTNLVTTTAGSVHNEVIDQGNILSSTLFNSRAAATLAAGATFQGVGEEVHRYGRVGVAVISDNATDGTLTMEVSHDNVTWSGPERTISDTRFAQPHMWNIVERYFRIKYVNGTTEATNLAIQVQYSNNANILLGHQLDETLLDETEAIVTRSVIVGQTAGGQYINTPVDSRGHLEVALPLTAFGDLRTAELSPIFQISFEYTVTNTEIGTVTEANGGTVTQADAMCVCTTGTTTGAVAEWETKHNAKYRPGLGGLFRGTALFTTGIAGTEQMLGLADAPGSSASHLNGYGVGYSGETFGFMRWQNDVLIVADQADWDDPMDGTGPSGMTLVQTNLNVYFIEFQYLGAGAIALWIESDITGKMVLAHTIQYTNRFTTPSVFMPNFHLMLHVLNGSTTETVTAKSASMAFFIEGKSKYTELHQPQFSSEERTKSGVTAEVAIFTIRNKTLYASKLNHIDIILEQIGGSIEASNANNLGSIRLVRDATLGGTPSFSDISTTDSVMEIDTSGTTVTGGKTLQINEFAGKNDSIPSGDITPYEIILSAGETITVAGTSANSAVMNANLLWKELF